MGIVNQTFYKKNLLLGVALHTLFRSPNNKNAIGPSLHVKDIVEVIAKNGIHQALLAWWLSAYQRYILLDFPTLVEVVVVKL